MASQSDRHINGTNQSFSLGFYVQTEIEGNFITLNLLNRKDACILQLSKIMITTTISRSSSYTKNKTKQKANRGEGCLKKHIEKEIDKSILMTFFFSF